VEQPRFTWDGLPVAPDEPHGAAIVVRRPGPGGDHEYLVLHRAHGGPAYEGDWAWTPPSGSRLPGEPVLAAARRELAEETGLSAVPLRPVDLRGVWAVFAVDVPSGSLARLDAEHDRLEWVSLPEALRRCQPDAVADGLRAAAVTAPARLEFRPEAQPGRHLVLADGQACGQARHQVSGDSIGIDCGLDGERDRAGLFAQLIWEYVRRIVLTAHAGARTIAATADARNTRLIGALERVAFERHREAAAGGGAATQLRLALDVAKIIGNEVGSATQ
jgi:8-oxo-dGTP pyrophosphatase MutT (NUDIX family)